MLLHSCSDVSSSVEVLVYTDVQLVDSFRIKGFAAEFCFFAPALRLAQMERSNGSLPTDSSSATGSM